MTQSGNMNMNSTEPHTPRFVLWVVAFCIVIVVSLLLAEVMVRVIPGKWSSSFFFRYDPIVGTWHIEGVTGDYLQQDYAIRRITMNSLGMRDREREIRKSPSVTRIAILGDSFAEGLQVNGDEVFSRKLEATFGSKVEVLNFAVSGFGTAQEYLTYKTRVRQFKPDIVLLAFFAGNDPRNNSRELEALYNGNTREMPFLELQKNDSWEFTQVPDKAGALNPMVLFMKKHFVLYRFAWYERQYLSSLFVSVPAPSSATSTPKEAISVYLSRLFTPPETQNKSFQAAWAATDKLIEMLKVEVEGDGAQFVLMNIPDVAVMEPDPRAALESTYGQPLPVAFDINYPEKHLGTLSVQKSIKYFNLTPILLQYRDSRNLKSPYFSFAHDSHWSALGHQVVADSIAQFLRDNRMIQP